MDTTVTKFVTKPIFDCQNDDKRWHLSLCFKGENNAKNSENNTNCTQFIFVRTVYTYSRAYMAYCF